MKKYFGWMFALATSVAAISGYANEQADDLEDEVVIEVAAEEEVAEADEANADVAEATDADLGDKLENLTLNLDDLDQDDE